MWRNLDIALTGCALTLLDNLRKLSFLAPSFRIDLYLKTVSKASATIQGAHSSNFHCGNTVSTPSPRKVPDWCHARIKKKAQLTCRTPVVHRTRQINSAPMGLKAPKFQGPQFGKSLVRNVGLPQGLLKHFYHETV